MLLYQPDGGYCYNSDSLYLYDFIDQHSPRGEMLDVGAGCGVVGLLVARDNPKVNLRAVEKQQVFVELASRNAKVNGLSYKIECVDFLEYDSEYRYDYIVSNPPFYHDGASRSTNPMIHMARYNQHLPLKAFLKKCSKLLKPHAHLFLCYDAKQFLELCVALECAKMRVVEAQFVHSKIDRDSSLVLVHARVNSSSLMKIRAPLIAFENDKLSLKSKEIYAKARTHTIKCQV